MRIKSLAVIVFIVSILFHINSVLSQDSKLINKREIMFSVNPVIDIGDCIKWHIDFSELKSTVLYKDHFISMGLYGGMIAIDTGLSIVNFEYSRKLNSDLYTNLTVRHDTLIAEKFNNIYFLSKKDTTWLPYVLKEPIVLFDILYEDDEYVFYSISNGEFGTILFIYDKGIKELRCAGYDDDPKCIFNVDGRYHINASLRHGGGSSNYMTLQNIDELNIVKQKQYKRGQLNTLLSHFRNIPVEDYPIYRDVEFDARVKPELFKPVLPIKYGIMLNNTFILNGRRYHFTDYNGRRQSLSFDKTYITEIIDRNIQVVDSIESYPIYRTRSFGRHTILEAYYAGNGYYISNGDSLFHILFQGTPDYQLYKDYNLDKSWIILKGKKIERNCCNETLIFRPDFSRKLDCTIEDNVLVYSFGDNEKREQYLQINNQKRDMLLYSRWNVLNKAFKYKKHIYLYFFNLGNFDHKYGLIEIYNLDKFVEQYTE